MFKEVTNFCITEQNEVAMYWEVSNKSIDDLLIVISPQSGSKFIGKKRYWIQRTNLKLSEHEPVRFGRDPNNPRGIFWLYKRKIFWENDDLDNKAILALIDARESKLRRKIEFLQGPTNQSQSRQYLPENVKIAVWKRDCGRCVKCGSNENLEFDHIIPVSLGGSSSERNLQLLCQKCNREKGADIH